MAVTLFNWNTLRAPNALKKLFVNFAKRIGKTDKEIKKDFVQLRTPLEPGAVYFLDNLPVTDTRTYEDIFYNESWTTDETNPITPINPETNFPWQSANFQSPQITEEAKSLLVEAPMLPKEILNDLEKGDRTKEMLMVEDSSEKSTDTLSGEALATWHGLMQSQQARFAQQSALQNARSGLGSFLGGING